MRKLSLLFTKDGLQWQISKSRKVLEEKIFLKDEDTPKDLVEENLNEVLASEKFSEISVISSINHFSIVEEGFDQHDLGYNLISYNADVKMDSEELMLSVNKKFGIQFYYSFPKDFYQKIKALEIPVHFNFSGEKFLNALNVKNRKEIHVNLYHQQAEFFAIENKKVVLYNNLDAASEVDFLYFIMFTLSKIDFGISETHFYIYGETTENETFISEMQKFVPNLKIVFDNLHKKSFILA
jgi:hypothetical protein